MDASTEFFSDYGGAATLAQFKIGDEIYAIGTIENGDFVAAKLLKAPAGPSSPTQMPCNCVSGFRTQATGASNLLLNGSWYAELFWQIWEKAYDVGHDLPLNSQMPTPHSPRE